jgi:hypothetical protein
MKDEEELDTDHCDRDSDPDSNSLPRGHRPGSKSTSEAFPNGLVRPRQALQLNDIFTLAGLESLVTTDATAHVSATLPAFPYMSVTDNQSGDTSVQQ